MTQPTAYLDSHLRWVVPLGAIVHDVLKPCDYCGQDVNVLTVTTKHGPVIMPDDWRDRADDDTTVCRQCVGAVYGMDER